MTPMGLVIIILFAVLLIVAILVDKNSNKKFEDDIKAQYPVKDAYGKMYVTEKGELLLYLPSGSLKGYKKWNLSEIGYLSACRKDFSVCDHNMQAMAGEYLTPSRKKILKERAYISFSVEIGKDTKDYVKFLQKYASHIQYAYLGKVVE